MVHIRKIHVYQSLSSSCTKHCCTTGLGFSDDFSVVFLLANIRCRATPGTFVGILLHDSIVSRLGRDCTGNLINIISIFILIGKYTYKFSLDPFRSQFQRKKTKDLSYKEDVKNIPRGISFLFREILDYFF